MSQDLESLRDAFQKRPPPADRSACFDDDAIFAAVAGETDNRDAIIDHLAVCSACSLSWRMAVQIQAEAEAVADNVVRLPRRQGTANWGPGLAAAATLILTLGVVLYAPLLQQDPVYRGAESVATPTSFQTTEQGYEFAWRVPDGPRVLTLRVFDAQLNLVFESEQQVDTATASPAPYEARFLVPAAQLAEMLTPGPFYWQIEARLASGGVLASPSAEATFTP